MTAKPRNFNLRVYGIWIRNNKVLLCRETSDEIEFTKFPGGGVESGEGIVDALKREFQEELDFVPEIDTLFYVNPYFQKSAFSEEQLVSVYYTVQSEKEYFPAVVEEKRWDKTFQLQAFWVELNALQPDMLTFPIDKDVARLLIAQRNK